MCSSGLIATQRKGRHPHNLPSRHLRRVFGSVLPARPSPRPRSGRTLTAPRACAAPSATYSRFAARQPLDSVAVKIGRPSAFGREVETPCKKKTLSILAKADSDETVLQQKYVPAVRSLEAGQTQVVLDRCHQEGGTVHAAVCVAWLRAWRCFFPDSRKRWFAVSSPGQPQASLAAPPTRKRRNVPKRRDHPAKIPGRLLANGARV